MKVYNESMDDISWEVAGTIDNPYKEGKGVRVSGCGMDMTFWLADILSYKLF
jgi:hypothetical protein